MYFSNAIKCSLKYFLKYYQSNLIGRFVRALIFVIWFLVGGVLWVIYLTQIFGFKPQKWVEIDQSGLDPFLNHNRGIFFDLTVFRALVQP